MTPEENNYYTQYFLPVAIEWEYMAGINGIQSKGYFFMKYYGQNYTNNFSENFEKNKIY